MIKNKFLAVILLILEIFLAISITGCTFNNKVEHIGKNMELNLKNCKIEKDKDTHGGFLGDGDYFAKIICTDEVDSEITSNWKELPLSEELQKVMNMIRYDNDDSYNVYGNYNIPKIENGYYNFFDRHTDSTDNKNDKELNTRSSYNFSLGIYDSGTKTLYYYALDT